jgi:thioredoxin 1
MSANLLNATTASFEQDVLQSPVPVLVDFWAVWCGPCKAIAPLLEKTAADRGDALRVVKVDVDANMALAQRFGVSNIPTLLLFKGGAVVGKHVGTLNQPTLNTLIAKAD